MDKDMAPLMGMHSSLGMPYETVYVAGPDRGGATYQNSTSALNSAQTICGATRYRQSWQCCYTTSNVTINTAL